MLLKLNQEALLGMMIWPGLRSLLGLRAGCPAGGGAWGAWGLAPEGGQAVPLGGAGSTVSCRCYPFETMQYTGADMGSTVVSRRA
jgi:hypothetical protein